MDDSETLDVLVVGGGFAGLAAALWLARFHRRVRVCDSGVPRNEPTWAVHGYPGIPDVPPHELRHLIREQAAAAGAQLVEGRVASVEGEKNSFRGRLDSGEEVRARRVLLAYGLRDRLPGLPGVEALYGISVFHCPDCDGPSMARAHVAVFGRDRAAANLALYLAHWAETTTLLTGGEAPDLETEALETLRRAPIALREEPIAELEARSGRLAAIRFQSGESLPVEGLFFHLGADDASDVARRIGCAFDEEGYVRTDSSGETTVEGLYAAGDITGHPHLAVWASAEGVRAALAIHRSLLPQSLRV